MPDNNAMVCPDRYKIGGEPCIHYLRTGNPGEAGLCLQPRNFRCIEALAHLLPALTYSSISMWIRCKMRYYYHYMLGIRSKPSFLPVAIKRGSMWDTFIEEYSGPGLPRPKTIQCGIDNDISLIDAARVNAMILAAEELELEFDKGPTQQKVTYIWRERQVVTGYIDRVKSFGDGFEEHKFSTQPDTYLKLPNIYHQCGTYFLARPELEFVDMMVATVPMLHTGKGNYEFETVEQYQERCFQDILSRPSHYFKGYDYQKKTYGKRFWRHEFDLDYIEGTYGHIFRELRDTIDRGSWYMNRYSCDVLYGCPFRSICDNGVMSTDHYYYVDAVEAADR